MNAQARLKHPRSSFDDFSSPPIAAVTILTPAFPHCGHSERLGKAVFANARADCYFAQVVAYVIRCLTGLLAIYSFATAALAHPPYGLVVDRHGDIYFSDLETVWRLSADGQLSVFRPAVPDTHVHERALAPSGSIEGDQNRYDPATQRYYTGLWSRTPAGVERAIVPMTERPPVGAGVVQDSAGNRFVTRWISNDDRRTQLLRRRPGGEVDLLFDETKGAGPAKSVSIAGVGGMAFAIDGSLYFAAGNELRRLASEGTVNKTYKGAADGSLRGLAATTDGVLAADMGAKAVLAITADGTATILYRETRAWLPTAVGRADGRLLVLEANADAYDYDNRVRLIEVADGRANIIASPSDARTPTSRVAAEASPLKRRIILLAGLGIAAALLSVLLLRARI